MWRTVIDWLLRFRHENSNSPVSTGDVTARTPGAEATECIAEACRNSVHTPQLRSAARCAPLVFVNDIKPDSTRSCVLNWDRLDFNDPIVPAPFIEDFSSSRYENNGLSKVQIFFFEMEEQDLGANLNIHLSVHVLLRCFDDFPQLLLRPYRNSENKTSANADGILFSLRGAEILLQGFRLLFWICYTEPHSAGFTQPTFVL